MERGFHMMAKGAAETSYANNSKLQQKALLKTGATLEKAVREVYMDLLHPTMTVVDLGCSSGQNTLTFVSQVITAVLGREGSMKAGCGPVELQFFLNDLPGNDFNHVFQSLERFRESIAAEHRDEKENTLPFYIAGLPGSYYGRLFPRQSCHLFHSSYCLHWRSQVPSGLQGVGKEDLNEGNIYIAETTSLDVAEMYRQQFETDMLLFLKFRYEELVFGGQMVLTFVGRKYEDVYAYVNHSLNLLARSLQSLVKKGLVEKEKLDSFNLPAYSPSVSEVKAVVVQSGVFDIIQIKTFESNWDPHDNSEGDEVQNSIQSGMNVSKSFRAVLSPLLASHFGESLMDELFREYACILAQHLEKENGKYFLISVSLKKT